MRPGNNNRGYTIPEILITLGVISIMLSLAVPSVSSTIKNNRMAGTLNNLVADLHFARSEAVKRDVRVIMCPSLNPNREVPLCNGNDKDWTTGYIIFADNGNYLNRTYDEGNDILLRRGQAAASDVIVRGNGIWNRDLVFNPSGTTDENNNLALMSICDDRDHEHGRVIAVAPSGIPRMSPNTLGTCYP